METPVQAKEGVRVIAIKARGSVVCKADVRNALGLSTHGHYRQEIELLEAKVEGFKDKYKPYNLRKIISTEVARIMLETIFERSGEKVKIEFQYEGV